MKPEYLYLHVPFCARRCSYCDFAVQAVREPPLEPWLDAVGRELALTRERERWDSPLALRTIYVGGGTPSLLGPELMGGLRRVLEPHARFGDDVEWTAEANPESFTPSVARAWRDAGVNRISLGAQTFHGPSLTWMGRLHGPDGPAKALEAARSAGIENVSIDLIFGLPDRLGRSWADDIERTLALEPEHVSLYGLTAEPGAPLGRWVAEGRERLADEDRYADEYRLAVERLGGAGLRPYEVSNFARPGRESRHNRAYWTGEAYLGLGPSAHSYLPPTRRWNVRDWPAYRSAVLDAGEPVAEVERVDGDAARLERVWLALRTAAGLPLDELGDAQRRMAADWRARGLAEERAGAVALTIEGWLLLDRLALELDGAAAAEPAAARGAAAAGSLDASPAVGPHS